MFELVPVCWILPGNEIENEMAFGRLFLLDGECRIEYGVVVPDISGSNELSLTGFVVVFCVQHDKLLHGFLLVLRAFRFTTYTHPGLPR